MAKGKFKSKNWKREAKASVKKIERAKKERDEAKQEAKVARLTIVVVGNAKARAEDDLTGLEMPRQLLRKTSAG